MNPRTALGLTVAAAGLTWAALTIGAGVLLSDKRAEQ